MEKMLIKKLHEYIRENNPDLLLQLEEDSKVTEYLFNKVNATAPIIIEYKGQPDYIIEEACMDELTKDLRPSKYNYINQILEEEFEDTYQQLQNSGTLKFEVINLISQCQPVFEAIGFTEENEDSSELRNAITGTVSEYLESNK
jgi:hypothetical protein